MAAPDVVALADELTAALNVAGIRARPYAPEGDWQPPEVLVPAPAIRQRTMQADGVHEVTYRLLLVVADAHDRAAHLNLGPLLTSTKAAIEADRTLGGKAAHVHVTSVESNDDLRDRSGGQWFGAFVETTVIT